MSNIVTFEDHNWVPFNKIRVQNLTDENVINNLVFPSKFKTLIIESGSIKHLKIPDRILSCSCVGIGLESIECNKQLRNLYCSQNNLTSLTLPENISDVNCSDNKITDINCEVYHPSGLACLDISNNQIKNIPFFLDDSILFLDVSHNPLNAITDHCITDQCVGYYLPYLAKHPRY